MDEFLVLLTPAEALARFFDHIQRDRRGSLIDTASSIGRVTAVSVQAPFSLPSFPRSTVDGYALRASDTHGASDSLPAYLRVWGEILMGTQATRPVEIGNCALIHTGGMLPAGADAVVMIEHTQALERGEIEVYKPVATGENVLQVGEDVAAEEEVVPPGILLRSQEIGGLMALGLTEVQVTQKPRVGIISSGDEVIVPGERLQTGQIYDINTYTLSSLVNKAGGEAVSYGIVPDRYETLEEIIQTALRECDMVVLTAGSSVSQRDLTAKVINSLGNPGVIVHGVNIKPGKPTILGVSGGKPIIGLPGNPVSALVIASIFVTPVIEHLLGLAASPLRSIIEAQLQINLNSESGREDYIPVELVDTHEGLLAKPVFGKSNLIFTLVRADGLIRIPAEATGLAAGQMVQVELI
jgi:molybdopterin molybdotransferase